MHFSTFEKVYKQELHYLSALKQELKSILEDAPPGNLRIHRKKGILRFGLMKCTAPGQYVETYLSGNNLLLPVYIKKYCASNTKTYVHHALEQLTKHPDKYCPAVLEEKFIHLEEQLGDYLPELFQPNRTQIQNWNRQHFQKNPYKPEELTIKTLQGELVRSKLECLCADTLFSLGLKYHYEKRLVLRNGKVIYPDFEILSPVSGKVFYLEVCGLMDDPAYRNRLFYRLDELAESNIVLGKNLLLVFESAEHPVNRKSFELMIRQAVLEE